MKLDKFLRLALPALSAFAVIAITTAVLLAHFDEWPKLWVPATTALIVGVLGLQFLLMFRLIARNPTTFAVSLVGFPNTGKTVYLTVLFDELQRGHAREVAFRPYGEESSERVSTDLNRLSRGEWLPRTEAGTVFYYRAIARTGPFWFPRRYKLELADFAGESISELDPGSERWLHKGRYFRYVVQSDAVLFAIDCDVLQSMETTKIEELQNAFVTALNLLIEQRTQFTRRMTLDVPLGVLFLKADRLPDGTPVEAMLTRIPRLVEVCRSRCRAVKYFLVSSTGTLKPKGEPPNQLAPMNVVDPILWVLRRSQGVWSAIGFGIRDSDGLGDRRVP